MLNAVTPNRRTDKVKSSKHVCRPHPVRLQFRFEHESWRYPPLSRRQTCIFLPSLKFLRGINTTKRKKLRVTHRSAISHLLRELISLVTGCRHRTLNYVTPEQLNESAYKRGALIDEHRVVALEIAVEIIRILRTEKLPINLH